VIQDLATVRTPDLPRDPVVVVGSGAAGIPLALWLADHGHRVVLLESGGDVRGRGAVTESADLNHGQVEGQRYGGLVNGRARVLGGATQLWVGQCMRLFDLDLRPRSWVPDSGWPLELADLEAGYAVAERFLDVSGKGYDEVRWTEWPALPPVAWNPDHLLHTFTEFSGRMHLGTAHRARMAQHENLWVVLHATASRVRVDGGRTTGVDVVSTGGRTLSIDARTVVLAAGTIENSRLLQLSDPAGVGLGDGREHTGRYLQDHPVVHTAEVEPLDWTYLQDRYVGLRRSGRRLWPKVRLAAKAQEAYGLLDAAAVFQHSHDRTALDAVGRLAEALRDRRIPEDASADVARAAGAVPALARALYRRQVKGLQSAGGRPARVRLEVWVEQAPKRERRVTLADSRDALGLRQPAVNWSCDAEELETTRQLTRWIAEDLERLGIARVRELPAMTDDEAWRDTVHDSFHPAGTTRMADSPRRGVVDRDLRVHGVGGLYVVGGSVFPTSGYANPTLTISALALRLAAHLDRAVRFPG
jgi:choline dehydrogenase-like flavoprotein